MKKQFLSLLMLLSLVVNALVAQEHISPATTKNIEKVFGHASKGYEKLDAWELVKAATILIHNPQIQGVKMSNTNSRDTLTDSGFYKDFFDPVKLLADAAKMAPVDAQVLKFSIRQLEKNIPDYLEMEMKLEEDGGIIQANNYMIDSKNSKIIKTKFDSNQKVTLSVRVGNDLRLSVLDTKKQQVGNIKFIGDARIVSFTAQADGEHHIKIENVSSHSIDCLLMIETR
jgi:predicted ribosome quality control (RQC) complex YloA/Tae2 family protein